MLSSIFSPPKGSRASALYEEARAFFFQSWELFPFEAAEAGLHEYRGHLGRNSPASHRRFIRLLQGTLERVEALPYINFSNDDWLDRRGFISLLRTQLFFHSTFPTWQRNPQTHCQIPVHAVFHLVVRNSEDLRPIVPSILSILAETPRFLAGATECIHLPVPLWTKLAIESAQGAISFLSDLAPQIAPLSSNPPRSQALFASAVDAFQSFSRSLANVKSGPQNGFSVGRESFEFLTRERLGLDLSAHEIYAAGVHLVEKISAEIDREAKRFGKRGASQILEEMRSKWTASAPPLLEEYKRVTADIKSRLAKSNIVTLPQNENLRVIPVPDFLRSQFPTAAYSAPGPFDSDQTGIFWVNDLSLYARSDALRNAEVAQHFGLELTCAHEAYPGHHLQFIIQNHHPSHLRRMFSHAIYYEGWTLWCEKMSVDLKLYDAPHARLLQLHDALWRAHRILIDTGLHTRRLSYQGAVKHLVSHVGFTRARAAADVNWYTSAPTVPMSYLLGLQQVEALRRRSPDDELRVFNDNILSTGSLPWSWSRLA